MFLLVLCNMHIPTPNFFRSKIYGKRKSLRNKSQGVKIFFVKWTSKHLFFLSHLSIYFRLFFFHPDYTVGSGIFCLSESPDQRFHARGLYRRSGLSVSNYIRFRSPCPEDLFAFSAHMIAHTFFKCNSQFFTCQFTHHMYPGNDHACMRN